MKKQVILGLVAMILLFVMVGSAQAANVTNFSDLSDSDIITGNYSLNVSTYNATGYTNALWVNLSYCEGHTNDTWVDIGVNTTLGANFTVYWNTTGMCDGNYRLNATSNYTVDAENGYVNVTVENGNTITLTTPATGETISSGNYTFNATTTVTRDYVNFSWSTDNATWTEFASNNTLGKVFTATWNTANISDGTYYFNASNNCTILGERTETAYANDVVINNVPAVVVDSPEFTPIVMAALIGLLNATAILLRKKKE